MRDTEKGGQLMYDVITRQAQTVVTELLEIQEKQYYDDAGVDNLS